MRLIVTTAILLFMYSEIALANFSSACHVYSGKSLFKCISYSNHDDFFKEQTEKECLGPFNPLTIQDQKTKFVINGTCPKEKITYSCTPKKSPDFFAASYYYVSFNQSELNIYKNYCMPPGEWKRH
jgi:hypothetical protein